MTFISSKSFILDEDEDSIKGTYVLPSIVTSKPEVIPLEKSFANSIGLHAGIIFIAIALNLMGINLTLFKKPDVQLKKDIEFVLVDKEATPRNPNTKNRSDMNSRSGGINDPKRKVSMPSPSPQKASKPSSAANNANKMIKKQQQQLKQQTAQQKTQTKSVQKPAVKNVQPQVDRPSPAKPAPPTAKPSSRPISSPTPVVKPTTPFAIPAPKSAPTGKTLATGPIGGTSAPTGARAGGTSSGGTSSGSTYAPRPSLSPSAGGSGGQLSRGSGSGGTGNLGNPGGGGGAPGIDALREPDFGPYMRELQRRIKMNWDPPKGNESKRVVLLFKIAKDGRLLSCRIHKTSGLPSADQAALKAVELTAPFKPLPPDFKGQSIDIQFTFDYNVFGGSRY